MPNDREKLIIKLKGFDAAHYRRTEAYARQIEKLCNLAASEYASLAGTLFQPDLNKPFNFDDYPQTKKAAAQVTQGLAKKIQGVIVRGTAAEWRAACDKNDAFLKSILRTSRLTPEEAEQYQARNLEALQSFQQRKVEGLGLSQRVWKYVGDIKDTIELGIDVGLGEGRSAQQLSKDLRQCLKQPDKLFRRVRDKYGNLRLSKAAALYHPGQGVYRSSARNAQRLARTEVNMAYRQAEYLRWQQLDFVVGVRIWLSNNHTVLDSKGRPQPLVDICDELKGDYPKTFRFVGWHPQCRCQVTPILSDYDEYNKDRGNRLKAIVRGQAYKSLPSRRQVTAMPENFTQYIEGIRERAKGWKSQPYYIRDNFNGGTIEGGLKAGVAKTMKGAATTSKPIKNNSKPCTEFDATISHLKKYAYTFGLDVSKLDALRLAGERDPLRIEVDRLVALEDERWELWVEANNEAFAPVKQMQTEGLKELETKYLQTINQYGNATPSNYYADCITKLKKIAIEAAEALKKAIAERDKSKDTPHPALLKKYDTNAQVDATFKAINDELKGSKWFENGDLKLAETKKSRVNGETWMDGRLYLKADRLAHVKSALAKIGRKQSKEITTDEADAMATFWHEITHNRNKIGNVYLGDKATSYMELANEFVARKTLPEFYKKLGAAETPHPEFITSRSSTGYNRMVTNYDTVITRLKLDGGKVLDAVRKQLYEESYTQQKKGLINGLQSAGIKKADGTAAKGTDVAKIVELCESCRWETVENWLKNNGYITEK